jgi:hypothetical protein
MMAATRRRLIRLNNRAQPLYWMAGATALVGLAYLMIVTTVRLGGRVAAGTSPLFIS